MFVFYAPALEDSMTIEDLHHSILYSLDCHPHKAQLFSCFHVDETLSEDYRRKGEGNTITETQISQRGW